MKSANFENEIRARSGANSDGYADEVVGTEWELLGPQSGYRMQTVSMTVPVALGEVYRVLRRYEISGGKLGEACREVVKGLGFEL